MNRTFHVKNFERFQHYKDRSPPWIKLYNELLDDYEFARLQDASKLHLILIWLLASRSDNRLPYDAQWIGKRINATTKVDLESLCEAGFLIVDQELRSVEQIASKSLADCNHDARPERERETEVETEKDISIDLKIWPLDFRERFWEAYPRKVGKKAALRKLEAVRISAEIAFDRLLQAVGQISATEERFIPHPTTWLNEGRYLDSLPPPPIATGPPKPPRPGLPSDAELRARYADPATEDDRPSSVLESGEGIRSCEGRLGGNSIRHPRTPSLGAIFSRVETVDAVGDEAAE